LVRGATAGLFLHDACVAAEEAFAAVQTAELDAHRQHALLRKAVERDLITVGEALAGLRRAAPEVAGRVPQLTAAVGLRNRLVHGHAHTDQALVWRTARDALPALIEQLRVPLAEIDDGPPPG